MRLRRGGWIGRHPHAVVLRSAVAAVRGASVQYITWSLPQQTLACPGGDAAAEQDESEGEDDTLLNEVGTGAGREEWHDLQLDDDV